MIARTPSGWILAAAVALVAMAGLLACPAPGAAQGFGKNKVQYRTFDWRVVSSPHFEIYYYPGGDSLALRVLDLAEKANVKLTRDMGHVLSKKVPIILYISHNDFAQTNVTTEFLDEGTGGFTELLKNRVVLPFTGSYEELRHVVVHELVHAFMFDMLYAGGLPSFVTAQSVVSVPLWFAEGAAEWLSIGWEPNADMFMRDGTIAGYLPPLPYGGGYLVYKEGQAAMRFIDERYGPDRIRDIFEKLKFHRNFDRAFEISMGTTVVKFDEDFQSWLKKKYWPSVADRDGPEQFARRLTDHRRDRSNINMAAAVSPLGDRVAYISDRRNYTDIYIMSSLDGKILKRVIRGDASRLFESVPSFRSSLSWSRDGKRLAFVAEAQSRDVIYVVAADKEGKVLRQHQLDFDAVSYPTFSPTDDRIAFVGVKNGRSDLYLVDEQNKLTRLTDDTWDEKEPAWAPDGAHLAFSSDRVHSLVLTARRGEPGFGEYDLFEMNVADRSVRALVRTGGDDGNPAYAPDGRSMLFVSDRGGARNAYLYDPADSTILQLTDMIGGIYSLSWSQDNDRVVFSAFNQGGWDIFVAKEPLSLGAVRTRLAARSPESVLTLAEANAPLSLEPPAFVDSTRGALAPVWPDTMGARPSAPLAPDAFALGRPELNPAPDSAAGWREVGAPGPSGYGIRTRAYEDSLAVVDSVRTASAGIDLRAVDAPFLLPDSLLAQEPKRYRRKFSTEFAGGQVGFNSAFGLAGSTALSLSDFLGNDRFYISTDIFAGSLEETNILAYYYHMPKRWDYGFGVFHYKSYYFSRTTALGESFTEARRFSDRNVGFAGLLSYPLDRFRRWDFALQNMVVDRSYYREDIFGYLYRTGSELRFVTAPSVAYVNDNVLYSYYGPISGSRWYLYAQDAIPLFPKGLSYLTTAVDWRRYFPIVPDYEFAVRGEWLRSSGRDRQTFELGGYSTIRGYEDFSILGTNAVFGNFELRFPFINALGVMGPLPLGIFNLRGAAFADVGAVWNDDSGFRFSEVIPETGNRTSRDFYSSLGVGARSYFGYLLLKLDVAWPYYLDRWGQARWHFSLSPQF